jgi:glycosyltransferase involved in cell wall biosynthesis
MAVTNSKAYWSSRFQIDWVEKGGPEQSRSFYRMALREMPDWLISAVRRNRLTVCDWGCAFGDGTDILCHALGTSVTGIDFSEVAITKAREAYLKPRFVTADLLTQNLPEIWDVVFSSNTLEHFAEPWSVLRRLAKFAKSALVVLVPYREFDRHVEHEYTFLDINIPLGINAFELTHVAVIDASLEPVSLWNGHQILLVYTSRKLREELKLSLSDLRVDGDWTSQELHRLRAANDKAEQELTVIRHKFDDAVSRERDACLALEDREGQIAKFQEASEAREEVLKRRDDQIVTLQEALEARDRRLATLQIALEDRDGQIATLEEALRVSDLQRSDWEQKASTREGQIARLEEALRVSDLQRSDWEQKASTREGQIATLGEALRVSDLSRGGAEQKARAMEESTSWKVTAPLRLIKGTSQLLRDSRHTFGQRFSHLLELNRSLGVRATIDWLFRRLMHGRSGSGHVVALQQSESIYLEHTRAQARNVRTYMDRPIGSRQLRFSRFFRDVLGAKRVVLAPVAYDIQMSQRPDHLLEALTNAGYACIQLVIDSHPPFIRQRESGAYLTNMFQDAVAFFAKSDPILYLHCPKFHYFSEIIPKSLTIYDVLDDFSIFADAGPDMEADHIALLNSAEVVLFSSSELLERHGDSCREALLIENGVWPNHFDTIADSSARNVPIRVGYHGAISELLDFDLLSRIAELPGVELVLVGPVASFNPDRYPDLQKSFAALTKRDNVVYKGKVSYQEISQYLGEIDVGIIPFIHNLATNAVSPLKLFEFAAAQKPVLATRTNTLAKFEDTFIVGEPDELVDALRSGRWKQFDALKYTNVLQAHSWHSLAAPLVEFLQSRRPVDRVYPSPKRIERIDILNVSFFDWDGDKLFKGGAERYVTDLARLCEKMGARVRLIQNANQPFERTFNGFPVIGIPSHAASCDFRVISKALSEHCGHADLVIASPLELAACVEREPQRIVSINHGIHWDSVDNRHHAPGGQDRQLIVQALLRSAETVAVDTNFINWVRTIDWELARSIRYIPNYVDLDAFKAIDKDFTGPLRILYPRRLYPPRGLDLTLHSFESLLKHHSDIQLTFCGQANEADSERVRRFMKRHQSRVRWVEKEFEQMESVYLESHIVLIPTLHSEGTSLSCIEAMAMNNAIVATDVGGLPNLIINRFNGLLIPPDSNELIKAVERLYGDRALCSRLAANAISTSRSFAHPHWVEQWQYVIDSVSDL